jgi:tripartite ATP-independent transporter DctP family solute receptor
MRHVMDGPIGEQILKAFEAHNLVGLAFYDSGARSFYNTKKDITSIADLKGMKFRVIQSDVFVDMVAALGASATPMPYGEVYSAIETGVIDGAENNFPSYESAKHFEVAKHYSLDEHTIVPEVFVMSKAAWDKLTPEDQAIFKAAAKESMTKQYELWDARVAVSRKIVEDAGSMITTPDKQPFIDAMKPVYDKYVNTPELKDLVARIQATE